jgi:CubicO group peptidase (beta-lactamase class C family)
MLLVDISDISLVTSLHSRADAQAICLARNPSGDTIALMTSRRAGLGAEARVLGWRTGPDQWGSWPEGTIWHTGFTGTSLLIAPALDAAVALLTNAVHPVRRLAETTQFRAEVHQAVRTALGTQPTSPN